MEVFVIAVMVALKIHWVWIVGAVVTVNIAYVLKMRNLRNMVRKEISGQLLTFRLNNEKD
jgi:hypothetical protein